MSDPIYCFEIQRIQGVEWSELLTQFDDANIYQTRECAAVLWGKARLDHLVLKNGDEVVGLAQVASIKAPGIRCGTSLVFWGPICQRKGLQRDFPVFSAMLESLRSEYVERRGMLLRVIPNELGKNLGETRTRLEASGFLRKGTFYRTYLIDLSPPLDHLRKQLRQKWRNCLHRAEREGLKVSNETGMVAYDTFHDIFREMHELKQFPDIPIDPGQLRKIQQDLPVPLKMQIFLCEKDTAPLAGAIVSTIGRTPVLLLAASNPDGRRVSASYLLQWKIIEWLKEKKIGAYDLGGISPAHPSVNHFKAGMGGEEVSHTGLFELYSNRVSLLFDRSLGFIRNLGRSATR